MACLFGMRFQVTCLLGFLGFWVPINRRPPHALGYFLAFLALELSFPLFCNFAVGRSSHLLLPFSSLVQIVFFLIASCCSLFYLFVVHFGIASVVFEFYTKNGHHGIQILGLSYVFVLEKVIVSPVESRVFHISFFSSLLLVPSRVDQSFHPATIVPTRWG